MYLSPHPPQHARTALTLERFAHYLAGLLDADGHFSTTPQCVIAFHQRDRSLAFLLKTRIGYGQVRDVPGKHACVYVCAHRQGLAYIAWLVQAHLRHPTRQQQLRTRVLTQPWCQAFLEQYGPALPVVPSLLRSSWFAGFMEGDGSFQMKTSRDIRVMVQIDQKDRLLLDWIRATFGGYVGFRAATQTFYYSSTSFANAFALVKYFDRYQVLGKKRLEYVHWRKAVLCIARKEHLTVSGRAHLVALKAKLQALRRSSEGTVPSSL